MKTMAAASGAVRWPAPRRPSGPAARSARGRQRAQRGRRRRARSAMGEVVLLERALTTTNRPSSLARRAAPTIRSSMIPPSSLSSMRVALLAGLQGRRCRRAPAPRRRARRGRGPREHAPGPCARRRTGRRARACPECSAMMPPGTAPACRSRRTAPCARPARRARSCSGVSASGSFGAVARSAMADPGRGATRERTRRRPPRPLCPGT